MNITTAEKYSQPEVVSCWQILSQEGLQKCEWRLVNRYLPPARRVLDVGCGAGRAVLALAEAGYQVTGLDLSLPMLAAGRNLSAEARLSGANLMTLPFRNGSFEVVFMFFGAIQHIPGRTRRRQAIAEMARVTQSNGRLILGLDNLAPALICYFYWLKEKLTGQKQPASAAQPATTAADATLWSRETRRVHPLIWHSRGLARSLRWRTWPGLVDLARRLSLFPGQAEPGDTRLAQFSLKTTPGRIYYHIYQANKLIEDAHNAGWRLLAQHSGTELSEDRVYPPAIRQQDKQLFFAFRKREVS